MPQTCRLAEVIERRRDDIVSRFVERAHAAGASEALDRETIIDSLREYLTELASRVACEHAGEASATVSALAIAHAAQRFDHGYDVGAIVREYAALRELLSDVIEEEGDITFHEVRLLFKYLLESVSDSVVKYAALRDDELRRRTAEHIAFLAHELRNPLSSATMAAGLIRERGDVEDSRAFGALERGLRRAANLIDDALVDVRLRELTELQCSRIAMDQLLRDIASDSEIDAAAKNISLVVEGEGAIVADRKALRSAISNLVRNAVKFSHAGGEVAVRARLGDGRIIIEVEDSCGGIQEQTLKKLFDPFVQAGADRSGFGLGLAIAKQAVQAHGGDIRIHNVDRKGCVFVLDMPTDASVDQ